MPKLVGIDTSGVTVGTTKDYTGLTAPNCYLFPDGRTIGSVASLATNRANADTYHLYALLWNSFTNTELIIQTSGGVNTTRGVDALTDFNANKRMPLPDLRGRGTVGKDNMGGSTAGRITGAGSGIVGTTLGAAGGTETHSLTGAQTGPHTHGLTGATRNTAPGNRLIVEGGIPPFNAATDVTDSAGSGAAHQNTQPSYILNKIVAYK